MLEMIFTPLLEWLGIGMIPLLLIVIIIVLGVKKWVYTI